MSEEGEDLRGEDLDDDLDNDSMEEKKKPRKKKATKKKGSRKKKGSSGEVEDEDSDDGLSTEDRKLLHKFDAKVIKEVNKTPINAPIRFMVQHKKEMVVLLAMMNPHNVKTLPNIGRVPSEKLVDAIRIPEIEKTVEAISKDMIPQAQALTPAQPSTQPSAQQALTRSSLQSSTQTNAGKKPPNEMKHRGDSKELYTVPEHESTALVSVTQPLTTGPYSTNTLPYRNTLLETFNEEVEDDDEEVIDPTDPNFSTSIIPHGTFQSPMIQQEMNSTTQFSAETSVVLAPSRWVSNEVSNEIAKPSDRPSDGPDSAVPNETLNRMNLAPTSNDSLPVNVNVNVDTKKEKTPSAIPPSSTVQISEKKSPFVESLAIPLWMNPDQRTYVTQGTAIPAKLSLLKKWMEVLHVIRKYCENDWLFAKHQKMDTSKFTSNHIHLEYQLFYTVSFIQKYHLKLLESEYEEWNRFLDFMKFNGKSVEDSMYLRKNPISNEMTKDTDLNDAKDLKESKSATEIQTFQPEPVNTTLPVHSVPSNELVQSQRDSMERQSIESPRIEISENREKNSQEAPKEISKETLDEIDSDPEDVISVHSVVSSQWEAVSLDENDENAVNDTNVTDIVPFQSDSKIQPHSVSATPKKSKTRKKKSKKKTKAKIKTKTKTKMNIVKLL